MRRYEEVVGFYMLHERLRVIGAGGSCHVSTRETKSYSSATVDAKNSTRRVKSRGGRRGEAKLKQSSSGRYLPPAAHPLSTALCGSGLVYACVY